MTVVFFISVFLLLPIFVSAEEVPSTYDSHVGKKTSFVSKHVLEWIGNTFIEESRKMFPPKKSVDQVEGRVGKKKHKISKYILPLLIGFLLIKSILLPIALKALAVLSGKAVILSLMSLILAAIVGLKKITHSGDKTVDIVTVPLSKYRRKDMFYDWEEAETEDPYGYYRDRPIDIPRKTRYDKNQ